MAPDKKAERPAFTAWAKANAIWAGSVAKATADAAMYAMALEHHATLWTQDADYQGLGGVKYFPKP